MVTILLVWFLGVLAASFCWGLLTGYNSRKGKPDWDDNEVTLGVWACVLWPLSTVILSLMGVFILGATLVGGKK